MRHFEMLSELRKEFPETIAASQNLVMCAADLRHGRAQPAQPHLGLAERAQAELIRLLKITIRCAAKETKMQDHEELQKFLIGMIAKVALSSPLWNDTFPVVVDAMYQSHADNISIVAQCLNHM